MSRLRVAALMSITMLVAADLHAQTTSPPAIPFQEPPNRVGITMGYPSHLGVVWELSDRFAIRPELSFNVGTSEGSAAGITATSSDSWTVGVGVSVLYYIAEWDALKAYVAPRFSYSRGTSTVDTSFGGDNDLKSEGITLNGFFGAQYSLHRRFSVFGEVGVGYSSGETRLSRVDGKTETDSFGTRTGVGVIFFF